MSPVKQWASKLTHLILPVKQRIKQTYIFDIASQIVTKQTYTFDIASQRTTEQTYTFDIASQTARNNLIHFKLLYFKVDFLLSQ